MVAWYAAPGACSGEMTKRFFFLRKKLLPPRLATSSACGVWRGSVCMCVRAYAKPMAVLQRSPLPSFLYTRHPPSIPHSPALCGGVHSGPSSVESTSSAPIPGHTLALLLPPMLPARPTRSGPGGELRGLEAAEERRRLLLLLDTALLVLVVVLLEGEGDGVRAVRVPLVLLLVLLLRAVCCVGVGCG